MTAVLHINCHLVSNLFEIKTCMQVSNKLWFEPFMHKKKTKRKRLLTVSPLSNFCVVRRRANKKNSSTCHAIPLEIQRTCRSKKKTCLVVACKRVHMHMLRGSYVLPSLQPKWPWQVPCCKHPFGSSSLHSSPHASHIRTNQTSS